MSAFLTPQACEGGCCDPCNPSVRCAYNTTTNLVDWNVKDATQAWTVLICNGPDGVTETLTTITLDENGDARGSLSPIDPEDPCRYVIRAVGCDGETRETTCPSNCGTAVVTGPSYFDLTPNGPARTPVAVWNVVVDRPTQWRIYWRNSAGVRTLEGQGNVSPGVPFILAGPGQTIRGLFLTPEGHLFTAELELNQGCGWFIAAECRTAIATALATGCFATLLPSTQSPSCIPANLIRSIELTQPASTVTISGYPQPPLANINGTYNATGSGGTTLSNHNGWETNVYSRDSNINCRSVSGRVLSTHTTTDPFAFPRRFVSVHYGKSKTVAWAEATRTYKYHSWLCITPCPANLMPEITINGVTGGLSTTLSQWGPPSIPPGLTAPSPTALDGTVQVT
jgi:hypothetical protein